MLDSHLGDLLTVVLILGILLAVASTVLAKLISHCQILGHCMIIAYYGSFIRPNPLCVLPGVTPIFDTNFFFFVMALFVSPKILVWLNLKSSLGDLGGLAIPIWARAKHVGMIVRTHIGDVGFMNDC